MEIFDIMFINFLIIIKKKSKSTYFPNAVRKSGHFITHTVRKYLMLYAGLLIRQKTQGENWVQGLTVCKNSSTNFANLQTL